MYYKSFKHLYVLILFRVYWTLLAVFGVGVTRRGANEQWIHFTLYQETKRKHKTELLDNKYNRRIARYSRKYLNEREMSKERDTEKTKTRMEGVGIEGGREAQLLDVVHFLPYSILPSPGLSSRSGTQCTPASESKHKCFVVTIQVQAAITMHVLVYTCV